MKTLSPGAKVQILAGKHKGKSAVVKELNSTQVCCSFDNFSLWFFPDSLEEFEEEDWGGNGDYAGDSRWNPAHFAPIYHPDPNGQLTIFPIRVIEPPEPDDYKNLYKYERAWQRWQKNYGGAIT
jgi:hypothetical protein